MLILLKNTTQWWIMFFVWINNLDSRPQFEVATSRLAGIRGARREHTLRPGWGLTLWHVGCNTLTPILREPAARTKAALRRLLVLVGTVLKWTDTDVVTNDNPFGLECEHGTDVFLCFTGYFRQIRQQELHRVMVFMDTRRFSIVSIMKVISQVAP